MEKLLEKYKKLNYSMSLEDEREMIIKYIYFTNHLEGNKLTLGQTTSILDKGIVSGNNISLHDILEHKGMEKAVFRMLKAVRNRESLTKDLMLELNWLCIGSLFKSSDAYITAKEKGQKEWQFKKTENLIKITYPNENTKIISPCSTAKNVDANMARLIKQVVYSKSKIIDKGAFLAQEIWLHQPFIDGNKRTGRLLINFLTMKEGYPLFIYGNKAVNYNNQLIEQYLFKKPNLVINYIKEELKKEMQKTIDIFKQAEKNKNIGFRMFI